jgi:hypothetical protein
LHGGAIGTQAIGATFSSESPEAFITAANNWMEEYVTALSDPANLTLAARRKFTGAANANNIRNLLASEHLTLDIFNKKTADTLYRSYRDNLAKIGDIIQSDLIGLPGQVLPSENPYSIFTKLIVDPTSTAAGEGTHPFLTLLSRLNINISTSAENIEDIKLSRNRIPNVQSVVREYQRSKKYFPQGYGINPVSSAEPGPRGAMNMLGFDDADIGKEFTIHTFDTETTGRATDSQVRSFSVVERRVKYTGNGEYETLSAPKVIMNKQFKSGQMDIAHTYKNGVKMPLSEATILDEGADTMLERARAAFDDGGKVFIEDMKEILDLFVNKSDRVGGHYAEVFDLDKIFQTLIGTPEFHKDKEIQNLYARFQQRRIEDPSFFFDTHSSAQRLFDEQKSVLRGKIIGALGEETEAAKQAAEQFIGEFQLAPELLAKGATTPQSMENIILNTNFLQLLENESPDMTESLMKTISQRGTHTADVDSLLEDFLAKYIQTGKLQLQRFPTAGKPVGLMTADAAGQYLNNNYERISRAAQEYGFIRKDRTMSSFENYMRRSASRSGAVTPITNISGVDRVSDEVFQFLSETSTGQQKVTLDVTPDILRDELGFSGATEHMRGQLSYNSKNKQFEFTNFGDNQVQKIEEGKAREFIRKTLIESRDTSATENIVLGTTKAGEQITATVNPGQWRTNDIHFTNIQATKFDQMVEARKIASTVTKRTSPVSAESLSITAGLDKVSMTPENYARTIAEKGLPYADLDMQTRVLAVENAKATSKLGRIILSNSADAKAQQISKAVEAGGDIIAKENMDLLSEMGIQWFAGQGKNAAFGTSAFADNSYFRLPTQSQSAGRASKVIMTSDDFTQLTIRGRADESIKIGSQAFIESRYNNFYRSFFTMGDTPAVNQVFNASGLNDVALKGLAEDVMELQVKRFMSETEDGVRIVSQKNSVMQDDIIALGKSIFGEHVDDTSLVEELFSLDKAKRLAHLESYDKSQSAISNGVSSVQNYERTVGELSTTIKEGGIVAYTNTDAEVVEQMKQASERAGLAISEQTDELARTQQSQMVLSSEGGTGAAFSQSQDLTIRKGVIQVTEGLDDAAATAAATREVVESNKAAFEALGEHAGLLRADEGYASAARTARTKATEGISAQEIKAGAEFIRRNKKALAIGAAVSFAAYGAHKINQRRKENELYERTIEVSPVESGTRPYGIQEALMKGNQSSSRRDPLVTAGVVGNLDRSKIGHSMMGSDKHSHLFGG